MQQDQPGGFNIVAAYDEAYPGKPIEYIFRLILSIYGLRHQVLPLHAFRPTDYEPETTILISYGDRPLPTSDMRQIHIGASSFFGRLYLKPASMPDTPLARFNNLPTIYLAQGAVDGHVQRSGNLIRTDVDIIASSFFMLSRYEEIIAPTKDKYDRFPATASLAYKEGFLDRPIVNEYVDLLWEWMQSLEPRLRRYPLWPNGKRFAVCLTHDVDQFRKYTPTGMALSVSSKILKHRRPWEAVRIAIEHAKTFVGLNKDPFDNFQFMVQLERELGFNSSFYFMASTRSKFDPGDTIKKPALARLARRLERKGFEVGLHSSFDSYNDLDLMMSEKRTMDRSVMNRDYGCRQHYLRWKAPDTWSIQEKTGLLYDSTLSFADHAGFRCGICLPFKPFHATESRELGIWELPLTIMDSTLQSPQYQNLGPHEACAEIVRHLEIVNRFGGVLTLLLHNTILDEAGEWAGWREVYQEVMRQIKRRDPFAATGRDIVQWWRSRIDGLDYHL